MSVAPGVPSEEELPALPAAELAARLAEAYRLIGELTSRNERLAERIGQLERQAGKDSSTSSRPPSSDNPYKKKSRDRSLRERGRRRPGKQPGEPGSTMKLVDDPDEIIACPPRVCCGCGADLAGAPVMAQRRHQVTDIAPAPAPGTTGYLAQAKVCAGCGTVSTGELPGHVRARASYGPETCAQAANLVSGHHIPVYRSTLLLCQLAGIQVSTGWMAQIRGKAAALVEACGFMEHIRALLKTAPAVHADETPARAAGTRRRAGARPARRLDGVIWQSPVTVETSDLVMLSLCCASLRGQAWPAPALAARRGRRGSGVQTGPQGRRVSDAEQS